MFYVPTPFSNSAIAYTTQFNEHIFIFHAMKFKNWGLPISFNAQFIFPEGPVLL